MGSALGHTTFPQYNNNVRVVNSTEAMSDKDRGAFLLLDERVDVGEEGLLGVRVEGGCLCVGCYVSHW